MGITAKQWYHRPFTGVSPGDDAPTAAITDVLRRYDDTESWEFYFNVNLMVTQNSPVPRDGMYLATSWALGLTYAHREVRYRWAGISPAALLLRLADVVTRDPGRIDPYTFKLFSRIRDDAREGRLCL